MIPDQECLDLQLQTIKNNIDIKLKNILRFLDHHQNITKNQQNLVKATHRRTQTQPLQNVKTFIEIPNVVPTFSKQFQQPLIQRKFIKIQSYNYPITSRKDPKQKNKIASKSFKLIQSFQTKKTLTKRLNTSTTTSHNRSTDIFKLNPEIKLQKFNYQKLEEQPLKKKITQQIRLRNKVQVRPQSMIKIKIQIENLVIKDRIQKPDLYITRQRMIDRIIKGFQINNKIN